MYDEPAGRAKLGAPVRILRLAGGSALRFQQGSRLEPCGSAKSVTVARPSRPRRDWEIRTHSDHLWITHDGQTEEYKRVADF
jgi:hypothetical protein